jgi:hypothetical protein
MARFAPVVPLQLARWLKERNALGDYHLLLAHDVLSDPHGYAEVYGDIGRSSNGLIIMDNSLIELGNPISTPLLLDACHIVRAQYAVMPDKLGDAEETYMMTAAGVHELTRSAPIVKPVFVLQGQNYLQCMELFDRFQRLAKVHAIDYMVSVPRILGNTLGSRKHLIFKIAQACVPIHLLGFSNSLIDDIACSRMPGVTGIDSASPIRLALQKQELLSLEHPSDPGPRYDFWEKDWIKFLAMHPELEKLLLWNIGWIRTWIADSLQNTSTRLQ